MHGPAVYGRTLCQSCLDEVSARVMDLYYQRVELGLCVHHGCKQNAEVGATMCSGHRDAMRSMRRASYLARKARASSGGV